MPPPCSGHSCPLPWRRWSAASLPPSARAAPRRCRAFAAVFLDDFRFLAWRCREHVSHTQLCRVTVTSWSVSDAIAVHSSADYRSALRYWLPTQHFCAEAPKQEITIAAAANLTEVGSDARRGIRGANQNPSGLQFRIHRGVDQPDRELGAVRCFPGRGRRTPRQAGSRRAAGRRAATQSTRLACWPCGFLRAARRTSVRSKI